MRKTIFTPVRYLGRKLRITPMILVTLFLMVSVQNTDAQGRRCALACNKSTQVSLNGDCEALITPQLILNADTTICPDGRFVVTVSHHGRAIPTSPTVTCANIGQTLEVMIRDTVSGNSCWGEILVEDKLPPELECGEDTLYCYQMPKYTGPNVTDNCTKAAIISGVIYDELELAMDDVFGTGNWDQFNYFTVDPDDLLTCRYDVIYLDGFTINNILLQNFVASNRTAIEDWVDAGGSLFINGSAFGGQFNLGFGGVTIGAFQLSDTAYVNDEDHPIFEGPHCPSVKNALTGLDFLFFQTPVSATVICPPGMDPLMVSENGATLLLESKWGDGHVMFGTIIPSLLVMPQLEARNLRKNILEHLRKVSPNRIRVEMLDERIYPYGCLSDVFVKRVERDYVAFDKSTPPNRSNVCTQTLYLRRFPVDTMNIDCPKEWTLANDCPVNCEGIETGDIPTLPNGAPTPEWAGVPQIDGIDLWPPNDFYCNVTVSYEDIVLPKVGCVTKIMRMWTISEWWCNEDIDLNCRQMIEIVDTSAPTIVRPDDISTTTSGGYECEADILLPLPQTNDICGSVVRIDAKYPGGFIKEMQGPRTVQLPVGNHEVVYYAYDDCYNIDSAIIEVDVEDLTPPVAVCDRYTVVGLTYDSVAHVYAETFDDATYDDCKIDSFAVKRMDDGAGCGVFQPNFRRYVEFCCDDIGSNVTVIFRAYDKSGNFNDCMVEVEVQDKILPHIYCPPDITISCDFHYDLSDLGASFGTVVKDKSLRQPIVIDDPNVNFSGPAIDGHAYDNCSVDILEDTTMNITQCNVGTITRTFRAWDRNDTVECTQTITIENFDRFDSLDITWPAGFDTLGCIDPDDLTEEITGRPTFNEDECDLVGYSFEDHVFPFFNAQQACLKIIRKWKVIDWCQFRFDPRTGRYTYKTYEYEQVIKVNDDVDPFFTSVTPDEVFCSFDTTCTEGPATLIAVAGDSCTPGSELRWEYKIDEDNDGVYDLSFDGLGDTINASGDYPLGDHRIKYTFEDRCGNKISTERLFSVVNCKAPTPYCKNGIIVDLMPMDTNRDGRVDIAMIDIWANDLDLGSFGPCGNPITTSFSSDTTDTSRMYDCDSLGQQDVQIWVTDRITGNQAFCRTFVRIQDNRNICDSLPMVNSGRVSGLIQTEDKEDVVDASVDLDGSSFPSVMSQSNGSYAFPMMPFGGRYFVNPAKDDMHLDGISTKDLIIIQRHLLGVKNIDSPYKLIAADVNDDTNISVQDLSQLRKLILGVYNELPNNTAWRFVNANYSFPDPQDPFTPAYPERYSIDQFVHSMTDVDFVAMKIGDVDNSVDPSGAKSNGTRSQEVFNLEVANTEFAAGQQTSIEFKAKDLNNILGYQFTLNYDAQMLEFVDVEPGVCGVTTENVGLTYLSDGIINVSWNQAHALQVSPDDILFTVQFVSYQKGQMQEAISINSRMTHAEAYDGDGNEMNLRLNFSGQNGPEVAFRLYQNHPNPFNDNTVIGFDLPNDGNAMLTIYDVTGKVVALYELDGNKGYNSMEVLSKDLTSTGVLYYQLDTQGFTATKKMVVLQ